ncbi:hypothetical protein ACHAXS_011866 [Conticribra weissflogii]
MYDYDSIFPDIKTDGRGRTVCREHSREECHICCMSFREMNQEIDENPSDRNVGIFIPEEDLLEWYMKMKETLPQAFRPKHHLFGKDGKQHPYGTLLLEHFDDDPNQKAACKVVGSRWVSRDMEYRGGWFYADGREPYYVVLMGGVLTQMEIVDVHGKYGMKAHGTNNGSVNDKLDALARNNIKKFARCGGDESYYFYELDNGDFEDEYEDDGDFEMLYPHTADIPLLVKNCYINQAAKKLKVIYMDQWKNETHGHFLVQFFKYSFTSDERVVIMRQCQKKKNHVLNSCDKDCQRDEDNAELVATALREFPLDNLGLREGNKNFYARLLLSKIVMHHMSRLGGVIIANKRGTKFQAIEFNNNFASVFHQVPCVSVSYATDPEGIDNPKMFLRGETYEILTVDNELAILIEDHLLNYVKNEEENDVGSGLLIHSGFLPPMEIAPFNKDSESDAESNPSVDFETIPDVNFGVELELSCASGNYRERTGKNLADHANVQVHAGFFGGKGKGSGSSKGRITLMNTSKDTSKSKSHTFSKHDKWRLVIDRSIEANELNPLSATFELVSPILSGPRDLRELSRIVTTMTDVASVRVNESMGLHVHVETKEDDYSLQNMISIFQNFLLYEDIMDSFLPKHRRTDSEESRRYFKSNKRSILHQNTAATSLEDALLILSSCQSYNELYDQMNPNVGKGRRYHKLNLQNLKTRRQPTIEFRQHHASKNVEDIVSWVRFCILFVCNASKLSPICSSDGIPDATIESLFNDIIKCSVLKTFYCKKQA